MSIFYRFIVDLRMTNFY